MVFKWGKISKKAMMTMFNWWMDDFKGLCPLVSHSCEGLSGLYGWDCKKCNNVFSSRGVCPCTYYGKEKTSDIVESFLRDRGWIDNKEILNGI